LAVLLQGLTGPFLKNDASSPMHTDATFVARTRLIESGGKPDWLTRSWDIRIVSREAGPEHEDRKMMNMYAEYLEPRRDTS